MPDIATEDVYKHKDHHAVDKGQKDYIQDDTHYISIQDVQHRHILARDITIFVLVAVLQGFVLQYKAQFNKMYSSYKC